METGVNAGARFFSGMGSEDMMWHWRDSFSAGGRGYYRSGPAGGRPFLQQVSGHAVKALASGALAAAGLGVLVLLFPLVLAFFVAGILFLAALICLSFAWRIYRSRDRQDSSYDVDVIVDEGDGNGLPDEWR